MTPTPEQERVRDGAGHTPGPWMSDDSEIYAGSVMIAETSPLTGDFGLGGFSANELANARLIAAAPELLEALEDALEFIEGYADVVDGSYGEPSPNRAMTLVGAIQSAISKARVE